MTTIHPILSANHTQYAKAKGFCEDLDEGKCSFVLLHALQNAEPGVKALLHSMLMQRRVAGSAPEGHKELIINMLHETGSLGYTADMLRKMWINLMDEVHVIEAHTGKLNPKIRGIIEALRI